MKKRLLLSIIGVVVVMLVSSAAVVSAAERVILKVSSEDAELKDIIKDIRRNPFMLYFELGKAYFRAGNAEKAAELFKKSLKMKADFPEAEHNVGVSLYSQGDVIGAVEAFKRSVELDPNYAKGYDSLGTLYFEQGDFDNAIFYFSELAELLPNDPNVHFDLGVSLSERFKEKVLAGEAVYPDDVEFYVAGARDHYLKAEELSAGFPHAKKNAEIMQFTIENIELE